MGNFKFAFAIALGAVTVFSAPEAALAASTSAGMSAIITDCLNQSEGLVVSTADISVSRAASETEEKEEPKEEAPVEDERFCR